MSGPSVFPDAESVVCALFEQVAPTVTMTQEELSPPVIRVTRTGGHTTTLEDRPTVEVVCFGETRAKAWEMAGTCELVMTEARGTEVAGTLIDTARVTNPSIQPPYRNPDVRQVTTYMQFVWRRQ